MASKKKNAIWQPERLEPKKKEKDFKPLRKGRPRRKVNIDSGSFPKERY